MLWINNKMLSNEIQQNLKKPWRLPRNLLFAALGTFAGIAVGILIHTFHRGLPYIAADIFIWSLATYNASQLGTDSKKVISHAKTSENLKQIFIAKNLTLLILAFPINLLLITIACAILGDWSKFGESIVLAISAVIICLGFGNIVSVVWVYKPISYLKMRHSRLQIFEYGIFIGIAYISATLALVLASVPGELILKNIKIHTLIGGIIGVGIMIFWAILLWIISLNYADSLTRKYKNHFYNRLNGNTVNIKNKKLKKILKVS